MRILIDALGASSPGGGRTVISNLLHALFTADAENQYVILVDRVEESFLCYRNVRQEALAISNRILVRLRMQIEVPQLVTREKIDLVHYTKGLSAIPSGARSVLTIYDMTTLLLPWTQSPVDVAYWRYVQPRVARNAARILTGSRDAKKDIERLYGVPAAKIHVAPFAPSPKFRPITDPTLVENVRKKYGISNRFILFVGILALKKNLSTLIRAFSELRTQLPFQCNLVIVGRRYKQSDDREIFGLVSGLGLQQEVIFTGPVSDEDLVVLFNAADTFAFPSLHEGFGIAPLEAMACGVPVVTTACGSLPEVVGDAGIFVKDPLDATELSNALREVLTDAELRKRLVAKGCERAKTYSWERTAEETLKAYEIAAGINAPS